MIKSVGKIAGSLLAGLGTAYLIQLVVEKTSKPVEPVKVKVAKAKPATTPEDKQQAA